MREVKCDVRYGKASIVHKIGDAKLDFEGYDHQFWDEGLLMRLQLGQITRVILTALSLNPDYEDIV